MTNSNLRKIVLVTHAGMPREQVAKIADEHPEVTFATPADNREDLSAALPGAEVLIGCPRPLFNDELLAVAGKNLRWVHAGGAGIEEFLTPGLISSDVVFTNGRIIQGPEVADHAVSLLLALTRNLYLALHGKRANVPRPIELAKKTAVVAGVGGIGMLLCERLRAFGMKVHAVDPQMLPMLAMFESQRPPERMLEILPEADVVICASPNTPVSYRMFNEAAFGAMKPTAYFVNVSRGKLVDTDALTTVLQQGHLSGVGLDVTDPEPLPEDHPLRSVERVIITPHLAGLSDHNRARSFDLICANIDRYLSGRPLFNVVDKQLGY